MENLQFKDLIKQKMEDQIEYEEFKILQMKILVHIDQVKIFQSINLQLNQNKKILVIGKEEIIIKHDGYQEVKKNQNEFEIVQLNDSNNKTINNNQFEFEEVIIKQIDQMESSALQVVYNVKSGKFGDVSQYDNWNGDNSDWKGDTISSSKSKEMLISQDLKTVNENLQESINTEL